MAIRELQDDQWNHIDELLLGKVSDLGQTAIDNRTFVDAVFGIAWAGTHWRELLDSFGPWNNVL